MYGVFGCLVTNYLHYTHSPSPGPRTHTSTDCGRNLQGRRVSEGNQHNLYHRRSSENESQVHTHRRAKSGHGIPGPINNGPTGDIETFRFHGTIGRYRRSQQHPLVGGRPSYSTSHGAVLLEPSILGPTQRKPRQILERATLVRPGTQGADRTRL